MFKSVLFSQVGSTEVREGGLQREDDRGKMEKMGRF